MRIAVTGRAGQVVSAIMERARAGTVVIPLGRPTLDLADPASVHPAIAAITPDIVVSAAAYTAVDKAEGDADAAFAINAIGAGAVAAAAAALDIPVIHLSTDYVFDGAKPTPYVESDPIAPMGVYGRSKSAGEAAVLAAHPSAVILRTAWVYSPFGNNFAKTMLRLAESRDELTIVADQVGNPTSALDIADAVLAVAEQLITDASANKRGVFHMTGVGDASWADFAVEILETSAKLGGPTATVRRIASHEYPTPAARPANSRLDCTMLQTTFGITLPHWRDATRQVVTRLVKQQENIR